MGTARPLRALRDLRRSRRGAARRLLGTLAASQPDVFFVEIGAGDGIHSDHLRPFVVERGWRGLFVEPVPYVFERLRRNYSGNPRVTFENAAIADHDGSMPFYHFEEPGPDERVPEEYHLLGSASREQLMRHRSIEDRERRIVRTEVRCMTFASLCRKHDVSAIDVLAVDAEGADCEILSGIDLDALRPRVLVYEDVHVDEDESRACSERLHRLGYETFLDGFDTWCLDTRTVDRLTRAWHRMREEGPAVPREDLDRWFAAAG